MGGHACWSRALTVVVHLAVAAHPPVRASAARGSARHDERDSNTNAIERAPRGLPLCETGGGPSPPKPSVVKKVLLQFLHRAGSNDTVTSADDDLRQQRSRRVLRAPTLPEKERASRGSGPPTRRRTLRARGRRRRRQKRAPAGAGGALLRCTTRAPRLRPAEPCSWSWPQSQSTPDRVREERRWPGEERWSPMFGRDCTGSQHRDTTESVLGRGFFPHVRQARTACSNSRRFTLEDEARLAAARASALAGSHAQGRRAIGAAARRVLRALALAPAPSRALEFPTFGEEARIARPRSHRAQEGGRVRRAQLVPGGRTAVHLLVRQGGARPDASRWTYSPICGAVSSGKTPA